MKQSKGKQITPDDNDGSAGILPLKWGLSKIIGVSLVVVAVILLAASLGIQSFGSSENIASLATQDGFIASSDQVRPEVVIEQEDLTVTASSVGLSNVSWRHKILNVGDICGRIAFNVTPNNPAVHSSSRLVLPDSVESQNSYRNRFACFEATGLASAFNDRSWTHYGVWRIDLGHPILSVRAESEGAETYLQASSNKDVNYEVVKYTYRPAEFGSGPGDFGEQPAVANSCEYNLAGNRPDARMNWDDWQSFADADGRVLVSDDSYNYCFRATDAEGNYVYVGARVPSAGNIWSNQWQEWLRFYFSSTSGTVDWKIAGPLDNDTCNGEVIDSVKSSQLQSLHRRVDDYRLLLPNARAIKLKADSDNKYYCAQATDQLNQSSYLAVMADLQPPVITVKLVSTNLSPSMADLQITADKNILNSRLVGPLLESEFEDCVEVFAEDKDNHHQNPLWWERGERTETALIDLKADGGKYYCIEVEDYLGNLAIKQFKIPDIVDEDEYTYKNKRDSV